MKHFVIGVIRFKIHHLFSSTSVPIHSFNPNYRLLVGIKR